MPVIKRLNLTTQSKESATSRPEVLSGEHGPVLKISDNCYLSQKLDYFIHSNDREGEQLVRASDERFRQLLPVLLNCEQTGLFKLPQTQHLLGCLVLNPMIQAIGDSEAFWNVATEHTEILQQFVDTVMLGTNMNATIHSVLPDKDVLSAEAMQRKLKAYALYMFELRDITGALGILGLAEDRVWLIHQNYYGLSSHHIMFPQEQMWKKCRLYPRQYLSLMWTHLYRQLLCACGIYCTDSEFANQFHKRYIPDNFEWLGACVPPVYSAFEIERKIASDWCLPLLQPSCL